MKKFTIVIPTRERCATLPFALRTAVEQDYENLEIIVSDNASTDETRQVVESFTDPRIRYINTGRRVSMSLNWEFALGHVTGDYVTYMGDDDALLPGAVTDVAKLFERYGSQAVAWTKVQYCWPNHPMPHYPNLLMVPLANRLFVCDAKQFARDCASIWTPFTSGPCLYNAFADVAAMRRVAARTGGQFFHSVIPDAYSAVAIPAEIDTFLYSSRPFSVNGTSAAGNGGNARLVDDPNQKENPLRRLRDENDLPLHPDMPVMILGSTIAVVIEAIMQANDRVWGGKLPFDIKVGLRKIVKEASRLEPIRYEPVMRQLFEATAAHPERQKIIRAAMRRYPHRPVVPGEQAHGLSPDGTYSTNAARFGVTDVHGAARTAGNLIGPYEPPAKVARYSHYSKIVSRAYGELHARVEPRLWW